MDLRWKIGKRLVALGLVLGMAVSAVPVGALAAEVACSCEAKCTTESVKEDCPVCSAEGADLAAVCQGVEAPVSGETDGGGATPGGDDSALPGSEDGEEPKTQPEEGANSSPDGEKTETPEKTEEPPVTPQPEGNKTETPEDGEKDEPEAGKTETPVQGGPETPDQEGEDENQTPPDAPAGPPASGEPGADLNLQEQEELEAQQARLEEVKALLNALPETVTPETAEAVQAQLEEIDGLLATLPQGLKDGLDMERYNALGEALNNLANQANEQAEDGWNDWTNGFQWKIEGTTLTIRTTGKGEDPEKEGVMPGRSHPWENSDAIENVIIEEGVKTIGEEAFIFNNTLKSVELPSTLKEIKYKAFSGSTITSIDIPDSVTLIGGEAFSTCRSLSSVQLPANLAIIDSSAFNSCNKLTSIVIPESVKEIRNHAFYACGEGTPLKVIFEGEQAPTAIGTDAFKESRCKFYVPANGTGYDVLKGWGGVMQGPGLSGLTIAELPDFSFTHTTTQYDLTIPGDQTSLTLTPEAPGGFTITVDGTALTSGISATIPWGQKMVSIQVANGDEINTYTLNLEWGNPGGYFGDNGSFTWELVDGTLTIRGNGEMPHDSPWDDHKAQIQKVVIAEGVTTIASGAFGECKNLTSVTFPEKSLTSIGSGAFLYSGLIRVTIPDSVRTIETAAFGMCEALTTVKLPNLLQTIPQSAFASSGLTSIQIPDSVKSIENFAFNGCRALTSVIFQGRNAPTLGAGAFNNSNPTIYVPQGAEKSYSEKLGGMTVVDGPGLSGLTISGLSDFAFDPNTTEYTLTIQAGTDSLTLTPTAPEAFTVTVTGATDNGNGTYTVNRGTQAVTIAVTYPGAEGFGEKEYTLNLKWGNPGEPFGPEGSGFTWELKDGTLTIRGNGEMPYDSPWDDHKAEIQKVVIAEGVTTIADEAFSECVLLTSVTFPERSLLSIGGNAFANSGLTGIEIPDSVTSIGNTAFYGCTKLASVKLPLHLPKIEGNVFNGSGLTEIEIPDSVTSIGNYSFSNCQQLTSVTLPENLNSIGSGAFMGAGVASIEIPSSVKDVDSFAFSNCNKLTSVIFQGKTAPRIGGKAFSGSGPTLYVSKGTADGYKGISALSGLTVVDGPGLSELVVEGGTLDKTFAANEFAYTLTAPKNTPPTLTFTVPQEFTITNVTGATQDGNGGYTVNPDAAVVEVTVHSDGLGDNTYRLKLNWQYTLTFDSQGGSEVASKTVDAGTELDLTKSEYIPSQQGCKFLGWYDKDGKEVKTLKLTEDTTLYAKWEQVEFAVKVGTEIANAKATLSDTVVQKGETVTLTLRPDKEYEFKTPPAVTATNAKAAKIGGPDENGSYTYTISDFSGDSTITFVAATVQKEYQVTVKGSEVKFGNGSGKYHAGDTVEIKAGRRTDYRFDGWEGNVAFADKDEATTTFVMPSGNITVTATWQEQGSIKFHNEGYDQVEDIVADVGEEIDLDDYKPTRKGYKFLGWYSQRSGGRRLHEIEVESGTTHVYARWRSPYGTDNDNPKTGDIAPWLLGVFGVSAMATAALLSLRRKRK